ncbi:MAG: phage terminase small subunit P27 family [Oceanibaculum nanhaiense]|jgi:P27 family predicted phage terminase small subunit|uniref:phage terminase small subunit P27 family n=1 Tax=Oceanibaculum nanhaiense TaxID=1909734 RepID=UPI0032EC186A
MRGRKPQSAEMREAKGNPGRRSHARTPDTLAPAKLTAPKELTKAAKEIWDRTAAPLARINFLRETDRAAFARYCHHLAEWWVLTRQLRKDGLTYVTTSNHGTMKRLNPDFVARQRIEDRLETLEDRFGLTPAARQQILQRLAAAPPPAAGSLFAPAQESGGETPAPAPETGSPIGLLRGAGDRVH